jgi:hypothetical protein
MRIIFDKLNNACDKYYCTTECLTFDKTTVLFKGRVIFRDYTPKKHKWPGIKTYRLCDSMGYIHNMTVYLGKDRKCLTATMMATPVTAMELITRTENVGYKLFMDNFFSYANLTDDFLELYITVVLPDQIKTEYLWILERNKLKWSDIKIKVRMT